MQIYDILKIYKNIAKQVELERCYVVLIGTVGQPESLLILVCYVPYKLIPN